MNKPIERRNWILQRLRQEGSLTLETMVSELGVSPMTVNRDVQHLAAEGSLKRVHGGVILPEKAPKDNSCALCHRPVSSRMQFQYIALSGETYTYCCPHCGLSQLNKITPALGVYATDFLYGTMINAYKTAFVIGGRIALCCEPSVLSFKAREDAEAFCRGFGGRVLDLNETIQFLNQEKQSGN